MRTEFRSSFARKLRRIRDRVLLQRIHQTIEDVEVATSLLDIRNIKKLRAEDHYYRIRIGDYRIGLIIEGDLVRFVRCLHRSDICRYFP